MIEVTFPYPRDLNQSVVVIISDGSHGVVSASNLIYDHNDGKYYIFEENFIRLYDVRTKLFGHQE